MSNTNITSASAALAAGTKALSSITVGFQQGLASASQGVVGVAALLGSSGLSLGGAITGGIQSLSAKFPSSINSLKGPPPRTESPKEVSAAQNKRARLSFPQDLGEYFMSFNFYEYIRPTAGTTPVKNFTTTIALPLPQTLVENFAMQYDQVEMGQLVNAVQDLVGGKSVSDMVDSKDIAQTAGKAAGTWAAGKLAGASVAADTGRAISISGGFAPNPHIGMLFKGVNIREPHTFVYKLSPRTVAESIEAMNIVRTLKYRMHPATKQFNFTYPDLCDIQIVRPLGVDEEEMMIFKPSFLEGMRVNYAPNGTPTFFAHTRYPTEIELTLSFKEAQIFTRSDLSEGVTVSTPSSPHR